MKQTVTQTTTTTTTTTRRTLGGYELRNLLLSHPDWKCDFDNIHPLEISITVPEGGNYSGEELLIGDDVEIDIRQTVIVKKDSET